MKLDELIKTLEKLAPLSYACGWDNVGLLAGRYDKDVKRVFIALDPTEEVIEEAIRQKADLLITHHPLMLAPVKRIDDRDFITRRIVALIRNDIACYAMHTNFDNAPGCMADMAAGRLELLDCEVLEPEGTLEDGTVYGGGRIGCLSEPVTVRQLGELVKRRFNLPSVTVFGDQVMDLKVSRVAVCPGSGKSMIPLACKLGAEAYITGDIGHHTGLDAAERGLVVIDGGHYGTECMFIPFMQQYLENELGDRLEAVEAAGISFPATIL